MTPMTKVEVEAESRAAAERVQRNKKVRRADSWPYEEVEAVEELPREAEPEPLWEIECHPGAEPEVPQETECLPDREQESPLVDDSWGIFAAKKSKKKNKTRIFYDTPPVEECLSMPIEENDHDNTHPILADFNSLSYPLPTTASSTCYKCTPPPTYNPEHSYTHLFLAHAAIYLLAEQWNVDSLQQLVLHKLHATLCVFELSARVPLNNGWQFGNSTKVGNGCENGNEVVDLARFVYASDDVVGAVGAVGAVEVGERKRGGKGAEGKGMGFREGVGGIGGIRGLICQYMAQHSRVLAREETFLELLAGGGRFVRDFFGFQLLR